LEVDIALKIQISAGEGSKSEGGQHLTETAAVMRVVFACFSQFFALADKLLLTVVFQTLLQ